MNLPYNLVLLDLDGTVIDSEPGIAAAVRHALVTGFDLTPTQAELEEFMGPPLSEVLPRVFGLTDPADEQHFFELFCTAYFHDMEYDFDFYPGMRELVDELSEAGVVIAIATAKPSE
jgi:phosphoglycolate phosphatase